MAGNCTASIKAANAHTAGAQAVLIYNQETQIALTGSQLLAEGWVQRQPVPQLPALAITYSLGTYLSKYVEGDFLSFFSFSGLSLIALICIC